MIIPQQQQQNWNSHEETPIEGMIKSFDNYQPDVKSFEAILFRPQQQSNIEPLHKKSAKKPLSSTPRKYICSFQGIHLRVTSVIIL